ncbi:MAG: ribosomal protein S18-alanine N-acetyltransferase [Gammaproteobacteria bacterium]|nr:ribosomal protein S18-alanine N-acetyltransferase [Gammaproteobacteria bacterium]
MSAVIKQELFSFRPMIESDIDDVLVIEDQVYNYPWSRKIFLDCLRVGYCSWVLQSGHECIDAYGIMSVAVGECHILNLCVHPRSQRRGFGNSLLSHMLDAARKYNANIAFLEVRPSNQAARQLYLDAGFNDVGMRRDYYPAQGGREDAIIMARTL